MCLLGGLRFRMEGSGDEHMKPDSDTIKSLISQGEGYNLEFKESFSNGIAREICSTAFRVLRATENILNPLYRFYIVQRDIFIDELEKVQRGTSYPAITDSDVKNQNIPIPPLPLQQKITNIRPTVDKKIEAEENKKKALDEVFKSLLHNFMTGKIRVNHLGVWK